MDNIKPFDPNQAQQSRPRLDVLREGMDCRIPATEHVHVMRDEISRLRHALKECADDLEVLVEQEYAPFRGYPPYERKRSRDLETVREARELLNHN